MMVKPSRGRQAVTSTVPAPVGGLNARDAIATMAATDASVFTNLFPYADRVETRPGYALWSTQTPAIGAGSSPEGFVALAARSGATADELFGVYQFFTGVRTAVRIFKVNLSSGALTSVRDVPNIGGDVFTGEWTQFGSASGTSYLIICATQYAANFIPQAYDGASWSTLSITGGTATLQGVHSHRSRLWFYNDIAGTTPLSAWYLPTGAVSGALSEFSVAPFTKKGGKIVAMRTWTLDGGVGGTDDLAVFFTNRGEAIVYSGTDPASQATWSLVGTFDLGIPASVNVESVPSNYSGWFRADSFAMKYGSDLLFLQQMGLTSAMRVLRGTPEGADFTLSAKIRPLITQMARDWMTAQQSAAVPNMKMVFLPAQRLLLLTAATAFTSYAGGDFFGAFSGSAYAMNTETGAWTRYSNFPCGDMISLGRVLFVTDGGKFIYKMDGTATSDAGTAITFECRQAYNYFNSADNKLATLMQPMLRSTGDFSMTAQADADFNSGTISSYTSYTVPITANLQPWLSPSKLGRAFALHLQGQTSVGVVSWYATNWAWKRGGPL